MVAAAAAAPSELDVAQQEVRTGKQAAPISLLTSEGDPHYREWPPVT